MFFSKTATPFAEDQPWGLLSGLLSALKDGAFSDGSR
jgi:hypothetical protein